MTGFQWLALIILGGLTIRDLWNWSRSQTVVTVRILRLAVWAAAAAAILSPVGIVQPVADLLGIGRAADVILYLFVLAFLWTSFFFYARCLRLEREITALTRHLALRDATRQSPDFPEQRSE